MNKKKLLIGAGVLVAILIIGDIGCYWWKGTPEYSMTQLAKAVENKDLDTVHHYVDTDAVFESIWTQATASAMAELQNPTDDNPFAAMGTMMGIGMLQAMKPASKAAFIEALDDAIREGAAEKTSKEETVNDLTTAFRTGKYEVVKGDQTYIALDNGVKLILTQTDGRYWRISGVEGLDLSEEEKDVSSEAASSSDQ